MTISEKMRRWWRDPVRRTQMLAGLQKAYEANRNLDQRTRAERGIRASRTKRLKRLEAH